MLVDAAKTAVIVVDMWDTHYCKTYAAWNDTLARKVSRVLPRFRRAQIPILFMSGDIYPTYRNRAIGAILLGHLSAMQGIGDEHLEVPPLPDGLIPWYNGCPCTDGNCNAKNPHYWTKIHPAIKRSPIDLIGDWNMHMGLLNYLGINTLLYCGGATNVCVLANRGFSVWQSKVRGLFPVLLGNLTVPYLPNMGKREALAHVLAYYREKDICPVVNSKDIEIEGRGNWPSVMML